jgi:hypothetical protein
VNRRDKADTATATTKRASSLRPISSREPTSKYGASLNKRSSRGNKEKEKEGIEVGKGGWGRGRGRGKSTSDAGEYGDGDDDEVINYNSDGALDDNDCDYENEDEVEEAEAEDEEEEQLVRGKRSAGKRGKGKNKMVVPKSASEEPTNVAEGKKPPAPKARQNSTDFRDFVKQQKQQQKQQQKLQQATGGGTQPNGNGGGGVGNTFTPSIVFKGPDGKIVAADVVVPGSSPASTATGGRNTVGATTADNNDDYGDVPFPSAPDMGDEALPPSAAGASDADDGEVSTYTEPPRRGSTTTATATNNKDRRPSQSQAQSQSQSRTQIHRTHSADSAVTDLEDPAVNNNSDWGTDGADRHGYRDGNGRGGDRGRGIGNTYPGPYRPQRQPQSQQQPRLTRSYEPGKQIIKLNTSVIQSNDAFQRPPFSSHVIHTCFLASNPPC